MFAYRVYPISQLVSLSGLAVYLSPALHADSQLSILPVEQLPARFSRLMAEPQRDCIVHPISVTGKIVINKGPSLVCCVRRVRAQSRDQGMRSLHVMRTVCEWMGGGSYIPYQWPARSLVTSVRHWYASGPCLRERPESNIVLASISM